MTFRILILFILLILLIFSVLKIQTRKATIFELACNQNLSQKNKLLKILLEKQCSIQNKSKLDTNCVNFIEAKKFCHKFPSK